MKKFSPTSSTQKGIKLRLAAALLAVIMAAGCSADEPTGASAGASVDVTFARSLSSPLAVGDTATVVAVIRDSRGRIVTAGDVLWSLKFGLRPVPTEGLGSIVPTGPRTALVSLEVDGVTVVASAELDRGGSVDGMLRVTLGPRKYQPFLWSRESGFSFPLALSGFEVIPEDINDAGEVVGSAWRSPDGLDRAFIWSPVTGFTFLDNEKFPGPSWALGVNESGTVTGWTIVDNFRRRAFVWDRRSGMRIVPALAGLDPGESSEGISINSSGHIVVRDYGWEDISLKSFHWSEEAGAELLAVSPANPHADVVAINDVGQILGYEGVFDGYDGGLDERIPILWTEKGERIELFPECRRPCAVEVAAINKNGQIAGTSVDAVFRRGAGGDISKLPASSSAWARGLNDSGDILVAGRLNPALPQGQFGRASVWIASGELIDLGIPPMARAVFPKAMNNKGVVVGRTN